MRIKFKLDLLPQSDGDILMDFSPAIDVVNGVQTNYCIENDVVKAYREDVNYTEKYIVVSPTDANIADGAKPSLIANYTKFIVQDRPNSSWTERPRPVLCWRDPRSGAPSSRISIRCALKSRTGTAQ